MKGECTTCNFDFCWIVGVFVVSRRPHDVTIGTKHSRMGCKTTVQPHRNIPFDKTSRIWRCHHCQWRTAKILSYYRPKPTVVLFLPTVGRTTGYFAERIKIYNLSWPIEHKNEIHRQVHRLMCSCSTVHLYEALQLVQHKLVSFSRIISQYNESG